MSKYACFYDDDDDEGWCLMLCGLCCCVVMRIFEVLQIPSNNTSALLRWSNVHSFVHLRWWASIWLCFVGFSLSCAISQMLTIYDGIVTHIFNELINVVVVVVVVRIAFCFLFQICWFGGNFNVKQQNKNSFFQVLAFIFNSFFRQCSFNLISNQELIRSHPQLSSFVSLALNSQFISIHLFNFFLDFFFHSSH